MNTDAQPQSASASQQITRRLGEEPAGNVLVVDDERALRRANARILTTAGYNVTEAEDGGSALEVVKDESFDVILTDILMPGMDGVELMRRIREIDRDVPVVLITGNPGMESAIQAVELGALKYLVKPVPRQDLIETIGRAVKLGRVARIKREAAIAMGSTTKLLADRAGMEASLKNGMDTLWMAYQPIVNGKTREIIAYEALVRTDEPTLPDPGVLLRVAERLGRVHEVGRLIRADVARTLKETPPSVDVYVNLHPMDLLDEELYSPDAPLTRYADNIVLEITEREAVDTSKDIQASMLRLRELGYRIAVDDLGAGYAGLNYFAHLSPDVVKIDMSLIRNVHLEHVKQRLVRSVVALCNELGMSVIAEGVETEEERATLAELGCDVLQGYLFARPARAFPAVTW